MDKLSRQKNLLFHTKNHRKIMRYLLLPLLLLLVNKFYAQSYEPFVQEGKYWIYEDNSCVPLKPFGAKVRYFDQDTVIENKKYKKFIEGNLEINPISCTAVKPYNIISKRVLACMREDVDERKLYMHHSINEFYLSCEDTTEILLFDFGLSAGDTIPWCTYNQLWPHYDSVSVIIDSISMDKIRVFDGKNQEFYLKEVKIFYFFGVPLENCGMPFSQQAVIFEGSISDKGPIWGSSSSILKIYCEGTLEECGLTISSVSDTRKGQDAITIHPNPTQDFVYVTAPFDIGRLEVWDQNGRVLLSSLSKEIDVSRLSPGMYFIKCNSLNNTFYIKKFVKM